MREKLRMVLNDSASKVTLSTIHSFCHRLLKEEDIRFEILHGKRQVWLIRKVISKLKIKDILTERLNNHFIFVENQFERKGKFKYFNKNYLFPVMTNQETALLINELQSVKQTEEDRFEVLYSDNPQKDFVMNWDSFVMSVSEKKELKKSVSRKRNKKAKQQQLFD